jgi:hypothetical protein
MCNMHLLLNSDCMICPPPLVVTLGGGGVYVGWWQTCGLCEVLPEHCDTHQYYSTCLCWSVDTNTVAASCLFVCCVKISVACLKIPLCLDMMQFRLVYAHQNFRGTCCFYPSGVVQKLTALP